MKRVPRSEIKDDRDRQKHENRRPIWSRSSLIAATGCWFAVGLSSQWNLILLFYSSGLLARTFGGHFADNRRYALELLAMAIQTGLYAVLFTPLFPLALRHSFALANVSMILLTVLYVGFYALDGIAGGGNDTHKYLAVTKRVIIL